MRARASKLHTLVVVLTVAWATPGTAGVDPPAVAAGAARGDRCQGETPVRPERRSPDTTLPQFVPVPCNPDALPPPAPTSYAPAVAVPDRWRVVTMLGYTESLLDPYHGNNWLKGDRPVLGEDWFANLSLVSDTVAEPRRVATPVGPAVAGQPGELDTLGRSDQIGFAQNILVELVLYKGDTVFKPPEWEFRFTPVFNYNVTHVGEQGVLEAPGNADVTRSDGAVGVQALFIDRHLRNVSARYDFDSLRVGVQPFTADFRGFLFQDSPFGVRLFGTRDNDRYQYNFAWFRRIDKDTNSGLNDLLARGAHALRDDDVYVFNLYRQDLFWSGFTGQATVVHNRNGEDGPAFYDDNGVQQRPAAFGTQRPRHYEVTYLGASADGHIGRLNLTASAYGVVGRESHGTFTDRPSDVFAAMFAGEVSRDFSWFRVRGSLLYQSADHNPYDNRSTGFDAILENPLFAGADTSYWVRQQVPLIGGGRVGLSNRNGVLNDLRSSKDLGQSNFTNPGEWLVGVGVDGDVTPTLRISGNVNELWFADTASVEAARAQAGISQHIGHDLSVALTWRPIANQNIVFRLSAAALIPGAGYQDLFGDQVSYSVLGNVLLSY